MNLSYIIVLKQGFFKSKSLRQTTVKQWGRKVNSICRKYQNNPAENK